VDSVIHDASFVGANLAFVDFSGANLERAVLANCDLTGATLENANLAHASLLGALLDSAKLQAARMRSTVVSYESLSGSDILLSQLNDGSVVVERSRDVQFFISYSRQDRPFAERLELALRARDLHVWIDHKELLPGDSLTDVIGSAIAEARYVCAILSGSSLRSHWVQEELRLAMADQVASGHTKILPIVIERGLTLPQFLRGRYYLEALNEVDFERAVDAIARRMEADMTTSGEIARAVAKKKGRPG
jgi:hypothetical protein